MKMQDMTVGVVGGGVVGGATARAFTGFVREVRIHDAKPERATHRAHETVADSDVVFVCLPTPQRASSLECDLQHLHMFFQSVTGLLADKHYVLKSTVPVGTTKVLRERYKLDNLVHSPEFLTARTAALDAQMPTRNIVGFPGRLAQPSLYCDLLLDRWPHVPVLHMSSDESEAVKLIQNSFSAVKIAAFNEFRQFCDAKELSWETVLAAVLAGGWIHPMHTQVPGPDGKFGFGGSCLPKDLANLIHCFLSADMGSPSMLTAAHLRNHTDRAREK